MKQGLFISVEGIDGAGKSSHVPFIKEYLEKQGKEVYLAREPGGTKLGEEIRQILLHGEDMTDISEVLLYFASRQEAITQIYLPKLSAGICIVADRYIDSSIAYQGGGRQIGIDKIKTLFNLMNPPLLPNLTLLFDVKLDIALQRLKTERVLDRMEKESLDFFTRVQNTYHQLAKEDSTRIKLINTEYSIPENQQEIKRYLDTLLGVNA